LLVVTISLPSGQPPSIQAAAPGSAIPQTRHSSDPGHTTYTTSIATTHYLYLPVVQRGPFVNPQNRQESLNFYLDQYLSSEGVPVNWTGDHGTCSAGNTSRDFRHAVLRRINYFRAMAGISTVVLEDEYNRKAQAAALMMSVNRRLSHSPTPDWLCYSSDGAQGAGSSDLYLGVFGWNAISGYMRDPGGGNYFVGHRRWILYPQTQRMGTGDIPNTQYPAANALWVFDSNTWETRPPTRDGFVAWPPPGYVPYQVVFARWSFSYPQADFLAAVVTMRSDGVNVPLTAASVVNGYGEKI